MLQWGKYPPFRAQGGLTPWWQSMSRVFGRPANWISASTSEGARHVGCDPAGRRRQLLHHFDRLRLRLRPSLGRAPCWPNTSWVASLPRRSSSTSFTPCCVRRNS